MDTGKFLDKNGNISSIKIRFGLTRDDKEYLSNKYPCVDLTEALFLQHTGLSPGKCKVCSAKTKFKSSKVGYAVYCGISCAVKDGAKRGNESHLASPEIRSKIKNTVKAKYGVNSTLSVSSIRKKIEETNIEKYGAKYALCKESSLAIDRTPSLNASVRAKAKRTLVDNWLNRRLLEIADKTTPAYSEWKGSKYPHEFKCRTCSNIFVGYMKDGLDPRCPVCYPKTISLIQQDVIDWIKELGIEPIVNDRTILNGLELDIVVGKIAFEINGCYWHSKQDKNYHFNKSAMAEAAGVRLVHIFEDEILHNPNIIKNRIYSLLGFGEKIYARKTIVSKLDRNAARTFLENNHWSGAGPGAKYYYGLFYQGELISVMSFGRSRWDKKHEWEILRYASSKNVVGGASRLFSHFCRERNPSSVMTYSERRWNFSDSVYSGIGFKLEGSTPPGYWYVGNKNGWVRESRMKFQKHKIVSDNTQMKLSEEQIMGKLGYSRIYDCGNLKWSCTRG